MSGSQARVANRKTATRLVLTTVAMFGFGFALVPLYNVFCDITGLNGKTGRIEQEQALTASVDKQRVITVEFITSVNEQLAWDFQPIVKKVQVHPGEIGQANFLVRNRTDRDMVGQAIPSLVPGKAAKYFNKTECFCFTQQPLKAGESKEMPVRFIVDPNLPREITTLTLAYTFFDTKRLRGSKAKDSLAHSDITGAYNKKPDSLN